MEGVFSAALLFAVEQPDTSRIIASTIYFAIIQSPRLNKIVSAEIKVSARALIYSHAAPSP
jgi:hypothetical protein